jgi:hypothetical protein
VLTDEIKVETRETRKAKQKAEQRAEKKKDTAGAVTERPTTEKRPRAKKAARKSNK